MHHRGHSVSEPEEWKQEMSTANQHPILHRLKPTTRKILEKPTPKTITNSLKSVKYVFLVY